MDESQDTSTPGALAGYFYQVDVSIYVALELMLARKLTDHIVVEPANYEDLAADLSEETQVSAATTISLDGYPLVLQAKLRNGEPWSHENLQNLLTKGKRRDSPAKLLTDNRKLRYLLVTSAALKGVAMEASTRTVGRWPPALPARLRSVAPDSDGRIAVLDSLDEQKLDGLIRDLLTVTCKVPRVLATPCVDALRNIVLDHMRHGPSLWSRADLEATIRKFEGYLASAPYVDAFVKPTNWEELSDGLETRNGIIITGSSGTGKTMAAEVLLDSLKTKADGGFKVVRVDSPHQVWSYSEAGPVVFMIEDPWGKYRYHPEQRPWHGELDKMLSGARKDRRFIVTSRSDVLAESGAKRLAPGWHVSLETRHYGQAERWRLFDYRLRALTNEAVKSSVYRHRTLVLERLESPYEIQKFFDALREPAAPEETPPEFLHRCLDLAHYKAIETTIVDQVEDRDDAPPAVVLWGMLKARPALSWKVIPQIALAVGDKDEAVEDRVEPLIRFMAAGRNLRQPNDVISYYHPRVEAGLEQVIGKHKARASRLLGHLVEVFLDLDPDSLTDPDSDEEVASDWGQESAARLVQGAKRDGVAIRLSDSAQARLDTFIADRLATPGDTLAKDMELAADVGSSESGLARFARWIGKRGRDFGSMDVWRDPKISAAEAARLAADPAVSAVAERFVRELLPRFRDRFPDDFATRLKAVAGDLTGAFRDAALRMASYGFDWNARAVALGALEDFDGFAAVVDAAIAENLRLRKVDNESLWLEIRNGEHSEGYIEHLSDIHQEEGYTADRFLEIYVGRLRQLRGWTSVNQHPARDELIWAWLEVLREDAVPAQPGELVGLAESVRGHRHEDRFWGLAHDKWSTDLTARLRQALSTPPAGDAPRQAVLKVMARHDPAAGQDLVKGMANAGDLAGMMRVACDLHDVINAYDANAEIKAFAAAAPDWTCPFERLTRAVIEGVLVAPTEEEAQELGAIDAAPYPEVRLARARLLALAGHDVRTDIESLLSTTGIEQKDILRATEALKLAIDQNQWDIVETALGHRFADVRRDALRAIAPLEATSLPERLLAMAQDKGSGVRLALLDLLEAHPHAAHQPTLLSLIHDSWTRGELHYGEEPSYPVAIKAATLLAAQAPLTAEAIDEMMSVATGTDDFDLRNTLLLAIGRQGGEPGRGRLASLAVETGRPALHAAAAEALFAAEDRSAERAALFSEPHLLRRPPAAAVAMSLVVGVAGEAEATFALAKTLRTHPDRAALLLPLILAARMRQDNLADRLATLLPDDAKAALESAVDSGAKMPRTTLDALGEFRIREAIIARLSSFFEPKPPEQPRKSPVRAY